jgi:hypothetical protein
LGAIVLGAALSVGSGASSAVPAAAATTSITNYHFDPAHTGNDTGEPPMAGLAPSWSSAILDGRVYGEPLVLNNTVYIATQTNTIYALDAGSGSTIWSVPLAQSPYNLAAVPRANVDHAAGIGSGCGNIGPMGIIGTPVIDPSLGSGGTLFAVAETWDGSTETTIKHELVAVDLAAHTATHANIDPVGVSFDTGATRALEQERGALALAGGNVIVPFGGMTGDCGFYHGFVVSLPENLIGTAATFEVNAPTAGVNVNNRAGGIWGAGGPAVDASGNIYVSTGNGFQPPTSTYEYTDGVVKLNSSMVVQDFFGPTVWRADDTADLDLGSQGPLLIPRLAGNPMVFTTGKQLTGYLLDSGALSSKADHIGGELLSFKVCDQESFGASAYMATSTTAGYLYVPCREGLRALTVNTSTPSLTRTWQGPGDATGPPIVAGGLVWVHGNGKLYGLDPTSGATTVTLSGVDTSYNFSTPSASGGALLYVGNNFVQAFARRARATKGQQWTATEANGTRDVFQLHADGIVWRATSTTSGSDATWSAWASLGSTQFESDVAAYPDSDGSLELFALGLDGVIYRNSQGTPNGTFGGWIAMPGSFAGQPAVGRNTDGTLAVFARGADHAYYLMQQTAPHTWAATPTLQPLGGYLVDDASVGANADGRLELFVRGSDGAVWTTYERASNGSWSTWLSFSGFIPPGLVGTGANADGRMEFYVRGDDGAVWTAYQTAPSGNWSGWLSFGGFAIGDISVSNHQDGRQQILVRGGGTAIWTKAQSSPNGNWDDYQITGGTSSNDPISGANPNTGKIDEFVVGNDANIWQQYEVSANGPFHSWTSIGGGPAI